MPRLDLRHSDVLGAQLQSAYDCNYHVEVTVDVPWYSSVISNPHVIDTYRIKCCGNSALCSPHIPEKWITSEKRVAVRNQYIPHRSTNKVWKKTSLHQTLVVFAVVFFFFFYEKHISVKVRLQFSFGHEDVIMMYDASATQCCGYCTVKPSICCRGGQR